MKQIPEILQAINRRISEHASILSEVSNDIGKLRASLEKLNKAGDKRGLMSESSKLLVLKDKGMFHKAAILCLEDLKKEIES